MCGKRDTRYLLINFSHHTYGVMAHISLQIPQNGHSGHQLASWRCKLQRSLHLLQVKHQRMPILVYYCLLIHQDTATDSCNCLCLPYYTQSSEVLSSTELSAAHRQLISTQITQISLPSYLNKSPPLVR